MGMVDNKISVLFGDDDVAATNSSSGSIEVWSKSTGSWTAGPEHWRIGETNLLGSRVLFLQDNVIETC